MLELRSTVHLYVLKLQFTKFNSYFSSSQDSTVGPQKTLNYCCGFLVVAECSSYWPYPVINIKLFEFAYWRLYKAFYYHVLNRMSCFICPWSACLQVKLHLLIPLKRS